MLDAIARAPLWAEGLDYGHGTGHGVGYFLNVHEGPQSISKVAPDAHIGDEQGHEQVEFATDLTDLPRVVGDPIAFRRILENLTANAVDSLQSKPGRITVSTHVVEREGEPTVIRVTVADTGRGMSADESKRIFDDFYTTKEGGTGLGLSIVRRLVMDLGGTIGVESAPGQGTRMTIDIPAGGPTRT